MNTININAINVHGGNFFFLPMDIENIKRLTGQGSNTVEDQYAEEVADEEVHEGGEEPPSSKGEHRFANKIAPTVNRTKLLMVLHSLIDSKKTNYERVLPILAVSELGYFSVTITFQDYLSEFGPISKSTFSRWLHRKNKVNDTDLDNMISEIEAKMKQ